nr:probable LRR receptor-like serine/threonine-protein kinase At5g48740 [Ipomoea trifida]
MLKTFTMAQGLFVLIGGSITFMVAVFIYVSILIKKRQTLDLPIKKSARELELPEDSSYIKVPVEDIYSATNNLNESNCIGEGTAGRVYKGILFDNQHVAVKHIIKDGCMETFLREVRSLTHVRHPNLVALLGYGTNDEERFLIYELCPNGNLAQWLFGTHSLNFKV